MTCGAAGHRPLSLVSGPLMSRRSLRPQLNQIRGWVRQGRTDAWIAHQLEVTVQQIQAFKREQGLEPDGEPDPGRRRGGRPPRRGRRRDRRRARGRGGQRAPRRRPGRRGGGAQGGEAEAGEGRRGGARRRPPSAPRGAAGPAAGPLEGTFDHGEEGYGLWLDPAVQDDPVYAEHWAGHRPVEVTIEEDQIVIRRAGGDDDDDDASAAAARSADRSTGSSRTRRAVGHGRGRRPRIRASGTTRRAPRPRRVREQRRARRDDRATLRRRRIAFAAERRFPARPRSRLHGDGRRGRRRSPPRLAGQPPC